MKKILSKVRKIFWSSKASKGFTLIELLIVIAILGILTTAVLSAINPVEQINRGRDTGLQSDAEQLISAMQRYNATETWQVWQKDANSTAGIAWSHVTATLPADDATTPVPILTKLGPTGNSELLPAYITRITTTGYRGLYIYNDGVQGHSTYVCFKPQSQQFEKQATARCQDAVRPSDYDTTDACADKLAVTPANNFICLP